MTRAELQPASGSPAWFAGPGAMTVLALALILSRLPLLGSGYGSDHDSWRNIIAALHMREAGRYVPSRVPGFPVYEGLLTLLAPGGWWATNVAAAMAGFAAAGLFARLLLRTAIRNPLLPWIAFAFGSPLWVRCTQTIDYAFGLSFFLAGCLLLLSKRYALAGVMLALATGCRASYVTVNLGVLALLVARRAPIRAYAVYALGYLPLVALEFLPVMRAPETRELMLHFSKHASEHVTLVTLIPVLRLAVRFLLGKLGTCVVAVGILALAVRKLRGRTEAGAGLEPAIRPEVRVPLLAFALGVVVAIGGMYLLIPGEGAYLLPLLPFVLLALAAMLPRRWMIAVTLAMVAECFVSVKVDERRLVRGDLFEEIAFRRQDLSDTRRLLAFHPATPTVFVVGSFMTHRLLVLEPRLERLDAGWSAFHHPGVALRAGDGSRGFAESLELGQVRQLERDGWTVRWRLYDDDR
jgi:hypothetical protein